MDVVSILRDEASGYAPRGLAYVRAGLLTDAANEIERMRVDAERYRKLRDEENWGDDSADGGGSRWAVLGELTGAGFDAFVDALPETPNV